MFWQRQMRNWDYCGRLHKLRTSTTVPISRVAPQEQRGDNLNTFQHDSDV